MKLKNILMLGGVVAGAAYLRDKGRRDRVVGQARGLLDKAKTRATELADEIQSKGEAAKASGFDNGTSAGGSSNYSSVDDSKIGGASRGSGRYR